MKFSIKRLVSIFSEAVPVYLFSLICSSYIVSVILLFQYANKPYEQLVVYMLLGLVFSVLAGILVMAGSVMQIASWLIFLFAILCISQFDWLQIKQKKIFLLILTGILTLIEVAYGLFVTKSHFIFF
jgi:hypothetical protein